MTCEHWQSLLSPYLDGDLDETDRGAVESHLSSCRECRDLVTRMRDVDVALGTLPELEVSPRLQRRLLAIPQGRRRFGFRPDFLLRPAFQPILAAATAVLTVVSFYAFSPQRSEINQAVERQIHLGYQAVGKLYTRAESWTSTLAGYKDRLVVSLQDRNPLRAEDR